MGEYVLYTLRNLGENGIALCGSVNPPNAPEETGYYGATEGQDQIERDVAEETGKGLGVEQENRPNEQAAGNAEQDGECC